MKHLYVLLLCLPLLGQQVTNPSGGNGGGATSVTGTANQINCSPTTGSVVCSIPSSPVLPGSPTAATPPGYGDNSAKLVNSNFVRTLLAALNPATAVAAATITVLPDSPTYSAGVLTAGTAGVLVIDGYTALLHDRLLINNQAAPAQNGTYTVTTLGSVSVPYVLTRATDFNTASEINNAGVIPVTNGTVNAGTTWALAATVATLGTSAISYNQTNSQPPAVVTINGTTCTVGGANCTPAADTNSQIRTVGVTFGDFSAAASALSGSQIGCILVPWSGTIQRVTLRAAPSGSATVDVRTVADGSWTGPASTASIAASDIPALSSAPAYTDTTLTGWTTALTADTDVCFYLTSPATVTAVQVQLKVAAN